MSKTFWRQPSALTKRTPVWPVSATYHVNLREEDRGSWQLAVVAGHDLSEKAWISLCYSSQLDVSNKKRFFRYQIKLCGRTYYSIITYIPNDVTGAELDFSGTRFEDSTLELRFFRLPRLLLAAALICRRPAMIVSAFTGRIPGFINRLRAEMADTATMPQRSSSYSSWIEHYENWPISPMPATGPVLAIVFRNGAADHAALAATRAALKNSTTRLRIEIIESGFSDTGDDLPFLLNNAAESHIAAVQAGEVINPQAVDLMLRYMAERKLTAAFADEDRLDEQGIRHAPSFKPQPNRALMLSGTLTTGIWLFERRVLLDAVKTSRNQPFNWAETLRLHTWLWLDAAGKRDHTERIPFVLTHRRPDTACAPPAILQSVIRDHQGANWHGDIDSSRLPLIIRQGIGPLPPKVSLIVTSTARKPHVAKCVSSILANTSYPDFELILIVSQTHPLDAEQNNILAPLLADPRVRLVQAKMTRFNYSTANNFGVSNSSAPIICLINDDVTPINPDWLNLMAGHLQDKRVAVAGAKLYYENNTIQHGGVIMGIGGVADHAFRFLPRGEAGYAGRAILDQELSAVTGACLLVRRDVYNEIGGLDESYATAFNDVEFCMQVRNRGYAIIWCAQAELFHYETLSLGHHYAGERAVLQLAETNRIKASWQHVCRNDPFYNPNLSLEPGKEWQLAFPPRVFDTPMAATREAQAGLVTPPFKVAHGYVAQDQ